MLHMLGWLYAVGTAIAAATIFGEDVQAFDTPVTVPANTETLVAVGQSLTLPGQNAKAVIRAWCYITVGEGTTAVRLAVYAGTVIGGRMVGKIQPSIGDLASPETAFYELECVDLISNVGAAQYCVSVDMVDSTGDGAVTSALIDTTLLSG